MEFFRFGPVDRIEQPGQVGLESFDPTAVGIYFEERFVERLRGLSSFKSTAYCCCCNYSSLETESKPVITKTLRPSLSHPAEIAYITKELKLNVQKSIRAGRNCTDHTKPNLQIFTRGAAELNGAQRS